MYKFVYIDWKTDYDLFSIKKSEALVENVYLNTAPDKRKNKAFNFLYKLHNSPKINRFISLPFKKSWNKCFIDKDLRNKLSCEDKICFIFSGEKYKYFRTGLDNFLRKTYPNCKLLYMFGDKVQLYFRVDKAFSVEFLKKKFDIVGSYNQCDVDEYGLVKMPVTPHDYSDIELDPSLPESDVIFVGREKGRIDQLIEIYEKCSNKGLICDFHIINVPEEKQKYADKIAYNKKISYNELLRRVKRSRCVLNIIQEGADGVTLRDYEAIGMNKYLMTNNKAVEKLSAYNENMVIDVENLDSELCKLTENGNESWNSNFAIGYNNYFEKLKEIVFNN